MIKKGKDTPPQTHDISDFTSEAVVERFTKRNCKGQIKQSLELKK